MFVRFSFEEKNVGERIKDLASLAAKILMIIYGVCIAILSFFGMVLIFNKMVWLGIILIIGAIVFAVFSALCLVPLSLATLFAFGDMVDKTASIESMMKAGVNVGHENDMCVCPKCGKYQFADKILCSKCGAKLH